MSGTVLFDSTTNLQYNSYSKFVVFYYESGHTILIKIVDYHTSGGKNLIKEYLSSLPSDELKEGYGIRHYIKQYGVLALNDLDTRQLRGKLYEIKFSSNRIMYVLKDAENIYFLHACKKQKGKAEKFEIEKAVRRAKEIDLKI